jgi:hypothetical protein
MIAGAKSPVEELTNSRISRFTAMEFRSSLALERILKRAKAAKAPGKNHR